MDRYRMRSSKIEGFKFEKVNSDLCYSSLEVILYKHQICHYFGLILAFFRGNMSPMTPESEIMPSFACVVRMPSTASSMDRSNSPSEADSRSEVTEVTTTTGPSSSSRRDRLVQLLNLYRGVQSRNQFSYRPGIGVSVTQRLKVFKPIM